MTGEEGADNGESGPHQRTSCGRPGRSAEATRGIEHQFCIRLMRSPHALRALVPVQPSHLVQQVTHCSNRQDGSLDGPGWL